MTLPRVFPAVIVLLLGTVALTAHEKKNAGALVLTIGWSDEPAFSGARNAIELDVADAAGKPVTDPEAALTVQVTFGTERTTLPLSPAAQQPGKYHAWLVPTRAGVYTFHVSGTVRRQPVDVTSTCSEKTFACVGDAAAIQFPGGDPSTGQLADRIARTAPRADAAAGRAESARRIAFAALALSLLSVLSLSVVVLRGRRRQTP
jgi:hypothetical protein